MPLTTLDLNSCGQVQDLTPLQGMPLTELRLYQCNGLQDITPLRSMRLTRLSFPARKITKGIDIIRRMETLNSIAGEMLWYPPAEFWKKYDAGEFHK